MSDFAIYRPKVEFDDVRGRLTIEGVHYAYSMLATLGMAAIGTWLRIESRSDGTITFRGFSPDLTQQFEALAHLAGMPKKP